MIVSASLDFGSTRFKGAVLSEAGILIRTYSIPAPPMTKSGLICEGDPIAYYSAATQLLEQVFSEIPRETPIGIASQRSSFLLWDKETGHPETALISWQDRRAQEWCTTHRHLEKEIYKRTGLPLSPHYVGPKLACLLGDNFGIKRKVLASRLLWGTLETWVLWKWTKGRVHQTDISMAARTLLVDLNRSTWSDELLKIFGLPYRILPSIAPTKGKRISLECKGVVTTTIADQAACGTSIMDETRKSMLINLGTGGFVIYPTGKTIKYKTGYLSMPLMHSAESGPQFALEGTVNGIAEALTRDPKESTSFAKIDPYPHCFCSPETSGLGSPYWQAKIPFLLSTNPLSSKCCHQRRIVMEGIIFRVYGIIHDLWDTFSPLTVYLAGGLSQEPFIYQGIAVCLNHPIFRLHEKEMTLLGTARLAADRPPNSNLKGTLHTPSAEGKYLGEKFRKWKNWLEREIDQRRGFNK